MSTNPTPDPDDFDWTKAEADLSDAEVVDLDAARGLSWVLPWELDEHGNLTAPLTTTEPGDLR